MKSNYLKKKKLYRKIKEIDLNRKYKIESISNLCYE